MSLPNRVLPRVSHYRGAWRESCRRYPRALSHGCLGATGRTLAVAVAFALCVGVHAGSADITIVKPSNTGVPGSEVRVMTFDPAGNLWIAGRWPFWFESALAMLTPEEQAFTALAGGGFDVGRWHVWSSEDHPIPSAFIDDIEFTPDGIMWIASQGGLTRFDRHATTPETMWSTYDASNSPLVNNAIRSLDSDSEGHLWLTNSSVTSGNGPLFEFDPVTGTWTQYDVGEELPPGWYPPWNALNAVMVGSDDHVWVTHTVLPGVAEFDGQEWTLHGGTPGNLGGMLEDLDGNIWFTSSESGLWKWNGARFQQFVNLGGTNTITGLGLGLDGTVFVSTWYGPVYKMIDGTTPQFFVDAQGLPRSVIERPDGSIWINNYGSTLALGRVRQYTTEGALLRRMNSFNSGLPDYFVDNIQRDSAGNMWFATGEGGLSRMEGWNMLPDSNPSRWRNWGNHNDGSEPYPFAGNEPMYSMHEDAAGFIWMGGNGVAKWDPRTGQFVGFWNWQNSALGVDSFIAIEEDGNGDVWIASDYTGVYRLNPVTDDWEQHLFGPAFTTANYVRDMERDLEGNLWVATMVSLHFFNGTTWFGVGPIHGSPVVGPRALEVHPDGSVWIGASNGLIRYHAGQWTVYDAGNSPMPTSEVRGLAIREDGVIGFSVSHFQSTVPFPNGVVIFDPANPAPENWAIYTYEDDGLPHYQLGDVEFDAGGNIWVSTISEGVTRINIGGSRPSPAADLNNDGVIDGADLGILLAAWGATGHPADLNMDGAVDGADLGLLLGAWTP